MDDELLIEYVQAHAVLYDIDHPKYGDTVYKEKIWNIIGKEMKHPGSLCKGRWTNIRDNFRRSLRARALKSRMSQKKTVKYRYEGKLQFLIPFYQMSSTALEEATPFTDEFMKTNDVALKLEYTEASGEESSEVPQQMEFACSSSTAQSFEYVSECGDSQTVPDDNHNHPVDAFLSSITPTLKTFSPYYLNLVKSKIFAAVQEYELAMILDGQKPRHLDGASVSPSVSDNIRMSSRRQSKS